MRKYLEPALWVSSAVVAAWTAVLVQSGRADSMTAAWSVAGVSSTALPRGDLGDVAAEIVASNPFRLDRKAAPLPFGSSSSEGAPQSAHPAPRITGIAGPPWRASLAGVPGRTGEILIATGDTVGGWRVVAVRHDFVVIQAPDTVWRIDVRRQ